MKIRVFVEQSFDLDLRVNLGRSHIRMAQHFLNGTNIRPSHEQMGGEGVPQPVRS